MNKVNRLKDGNKIQRVLKNNKKLFNNICNIYYLKVNDNQPFKIAIIVSKKISKKAVVRNKIKRQIRAIVSSMNLNINNVHIVIVAKSLWLDTDYTNYKNILFNLLQKIWRAK